MTDSETTVQSERKDTPRKIKTPRKYPVTQSRRRYLQALGSGGIILLSGCGKFGTNHRSTPTDFDTRNGETSPNLINQTFRAPVDQNPEHTSFYTVGSSHLQSSFAVTSKEPASGRLNGIIREPGVWTEERWVGGNTHYTWLDDITITPTEVTVTIRDDAAWSDGHPITGSDVAASVMAAYIRNHFPPYYANEENDKPTLPYGAIDSFDIQDKSVIYRSSPGYFEGFWNTSVERAFGAGNPGGRAIPTHIKPYSDFADAVFENAHRAIQGEINPWEGWKDPIKTPDDPYKTSLVKKYLAKEGKYVLKFSDPKHVISTSAWDLVKLDGPEAVFEPNPYHRNAEKINYDRFILEHSPSEKRTRAALAANRFDYAAPGPTPQTIVESLPDAIAHLQISGGRGTGNELRLNFDHPALGDRRVRMAIMYALDQSAIANNIHQTTALPVTTPGGDCWDATDYVSKEWINQNFTTYTQDQEKAASLMRAAGYSMDGGQWIDANGEPISLPLATPNGTPLWEPTVASQLTDFGIQTAVKTLSERVFGTRVDNGELPMWADSGTATSTASQALVFWYIVVINPGVYGIYPREQFEIGKFSNRGRPIPRTKERYDAFTIMAPPIGHPDGPLQEYHPSSLSLFIFNNPPEAEYRRRVKTAMWLTNWFLPTIPINKTLEQHFIDDAHWQWPTDTTSWQAFNGNGQRSIDGIFASGTIRANPDNPEQA